MSAWEPVPDRGCVDCNLYAEGRTNSARARADALRLDAERHRVKVSRMDRATEEGSRLAEFFIRVSEPNSGAEYFNLCIHYPG